MSQPRIGDPAPDFELPATGNRTLRLSDFRGHNVVVYFYPRDNTPGCTTEGQDFHYHREHFDTANTRILGISRDSVKSHEKFAGKYGFGFDLLSDAGEAACEAFDVIREKNLYGRKVRGIERSTFLIDAEGVLRHEWRGVKVPGHVDQVLATVQQL